MGSQRVGHDWTTEQQEQHESQTGEVTSRWKSWYLGSSRSGPKPVLFYPSLFPFFGEGDGSPLQYYCLENPMDGGAWWAAVHGVAKSQTRLSDFTFTFHFHALEKAVATHSSVLAWRIPGTVEPGGLLSMGSHRVGHNWSDLAAAGSPFLSYEILAEDRKEKAACVWFTLWSLKPSEREVGLSEHLLI